MSYKFKDWFPKMENTNDEIFIDEFAKMEKKMNVWLTHLFACIESVNEIVDVADDGDIIPEYDPEFCLEDYAFIFLREWLFKYYFKINDMETMDEDIVYEIKDEVVDWVINYLKDRYNQDKIIMIDTVKYAGMKKFKDKLEYIGI